MSESYFAQNGVALKHRGCEIKSGAQEMAAMSINITGAISWPPHHCSHFLGTTFDFTTFSHPGNNFQTFEM